jgi:hypothetical protein
MSWILEHPTETVLAVLAFGNTVTGLAWVVIRAYAKRAESTPDLADDISAALWVARIDRIVAVLDIIRRCVPRVVVGPLPSTQPIASVTGRPTIPPMKPISSPPPPFTTLKPWPMPEVITPPESSERKP